MDGASHYTLNLTSTAWALYSPSGDFVSSVRTCLGPTTKTIAEYHVVICLLTETLTSGLSWIRVYLDSELVV